MSRRQAREIENLHKQLKEAQKELNFTQTEASHYQTQYSQLKIDYNRMKDKLEMQNKIIRGERVCDGYCAKCEHSYTKEAIYRKSYGCMLDCKCKDFKKVGDSKT